MTEEIINKWKDVSPEDITSEPNWEEGWELVHAEVVKVHDASEILKEYIGKRFSSKANFIAFINEKTGIKFSEKKSYDALFSEIKREIGTENFFSILGIKDLEEAEMRSYLADALYKGLVETTWMHQFSPLYERLTGEKIKLKRKIEKKEPAYKLAFSVDENEFINAWIELYKESLLPPVIHYKNIVIGPLGWLKSLEKRNGEMSGLISGLSSDVIDIMSTKFDPESQDIIIRYLLEFIQQIGRDPNKFELQEEIGEEALKHLKEVESTQDEEIRSAKIVQMIHVYFNDENLIQIINELIARKEISGPKVHGLYERYPYSFSNWVITPYGLIKQAPSWERKPTEELAKLIKKEFKPEDIEPELEKYHGDYDLRILEWCIKENPEKIMRLFGVPKLRAIAKEFGLPAASMIKNEEELIRIILLKLGFSLPPIIVGIKDYQDFLSECSSRLEREESLSGVMTDVYRETQMVLRDIAYFYIRFFWQQGDVNEIIREKIGLRDYKPFDKLGLGHFIELIRKLNAKIHEDKVLKEKFHDWFDRNRIIPGNFMGILDEVSPILAKAGRHERAERNECLYALDKLINLSKAFEVGIYPRVIRITHEVTNEYGIGYFEAMDDRGDAWVIEKKWLDPSKPYFMHSKTNPVAIDPIIIEKIF